MKLSDFEKDVFSQFGEDGIIEKIFHELSNVNVPIARSFIELGAHNGITDSNTRYLLINHGFTGLYIEGDKTRFKELQKNTRGYPCHNINEYVSSRGESSLEQIMRRHNLLSRDVDLLVIDIDGNDYWIFDSLKDCDPKIVCIEFNPTVPIGVKFVQPRDARVNFGSSATSIVELGIRKGYSLIYMTSGNMFFLRKDLHALLSHVFPASNSLEEIWLTPPEPTFVFSAIDGTVLLSNPFLLHWHRVMVRQEDVQKLPRIFRRATGDYSKIVKLMFEVRFKLRRRIGRLVRRFRKAQG